MGTEVSHIVERISDGKFVQIQNPYLFVVGCPRSGTTLLQRMLNHHPQLAVGYDSLFIPRVIKDVPVGVQAPKGPFPNIS